LGAHGAGRTRFGAHDVRRTVPGVRLELLLLVGRHPHLEAGRAELCRDTPGQRDDVGPAGVRDQQGGPRHGAASRVAASIAAGSTGGASRRNQTKNSALPDGPGSGLAATPATPRPMSAAAATTS